MISGKSLIQGPEDTVPADGKHDDDIDKFRGVDIAGGKPGLEKGVQPVREG